MRIWTGKDGQSHFEEGKIDLSGRSDGKLRSADMNVNIAAMQETAVGGTFSWHNAPVRQLVITLSGTLEFATREGKTFTIAPGDILLAEDTAGGGHTWKLVDDDPWRRVYVVLETGAAVPFVAG
ncbi:hypothetical protein [Ruegeria sp. ANG-R]|uniref:hypothetical protein n=1 Tax=Ruegeria sp. ANG-R TaxID=1577903 RepID=UPI0019D363ED|nr:hypothetical protein [Ruegeria sp. ANG-R]